MHRHTYAHSYNGLVVSWLARSAGTLHHLLIKPRQVGSWGLWGTVFQRNGFMEIRSLIQAVIQSLWRTDTSTPLQHRSPTWNRVVWEGVTVRPNQGRDMTCCRLPLSVKYLYQQQQRIALMDVKTLTRAFPLFYCSPSLSLFLFKFNKTAEKPQSSKLCSVLSYSCDTFAKSKLFAHHYKIMPKVEMQVKVKN